MAVVLLIVAALAALMVPGAAIGVAAGARWRDAVAAGPALTLAVVAVGTAATAAADVRWGPTSAGVAALVAVGCAAGVGIAHRLTGRAVRRRAGTTAADDEPRRRSGRPHRADLAVVVVAAVPALQVAVASRGLSAIPQLWDAIFHGAATRFIAETGRAGPTDLAPVSQPANPDFFYPDAYHALTSLLMDVPGAGLPDVLNAMSAATGAVFVLGSAVLAGRVCRGSRLAAVAAAVAAAGTWTFPYAMVDWGPLLPFALGVALIPGLLVLGDHLAARRPRAVAHALMLGAGMGGAWAVHPSVALAAGLPMAAQALAGVITGGDTGRGSASADRAGLWSRLAVVGAFALAAVPAGLYALWTTTMLSSGTASALADFSWTRHRTLPQAVAGVLDAGPTAPASVALSVAVLLGLVAAVAVPGRRRPLAAPVAALIGFGALYVLAAAVHGDRVRLLTGLWWDDVNRFAALLAIPTVVLAGAGVRALVPRGSWRRPSARAAVVTVAVLGLLVASGQAVVVRDLRAGVFADGPSVTSGERAILDELGRRYQGGSALGDPFDGSAWAYALHGVPMVFPAPLADDPDAQLGPDRMYLYTSMNRYGFDPEVARLVDELEVRWVVVGTGVVGGPGRPPGFIGLRFNPNLQLVAENPDARLYEVLPVAPDHPPAPPPPGIPPAVPPVPPPNTDSPLVDAAPPSPGASLDGVAGP
ncbi:MAG TPA: hypothetical protein H9759_06795 [Candidatus Dietzia intestinipullorum]|nr:hypothetical protein [Candidatus Dietzia intestinipullorum]